jgi:hypothetical protein
VKWTLPKRRAMNRVPLRTQSISHIFEVRFVLPRAVNEYECFSHFYLEYRHFARSERSNGVDKESKTLPLTILNAADA